MKVLKTNRKHEIEVADKFEDTGEGHLLSYNYQLVNI